MTLKPTEIVARTGELPSLPHVATKVMKLVGEPDTSAKELQEAIITDQGMTAQILKIANSAMFGLRREVRTLTHAIMLLGFGTIRSIVMASATKGLFKSRRTTGLKEKLIWEKSIGAALIARGIAEQFNDIDKEEAFIGGLMHNIGKTIFNNKFSDDYNQVMAQAYNEGCEIEIFERKQFGFDHAELGYCMLQQWNLSESLCLSVRHYLDPLDSPEKSQKPTAVISLAVKFCADLGLGVSEALPIAEQDTEAIQKILGLNPERLEKWHQILDKRMEKDRDMIQSF
jgi:HD-like signal output (HDOD) protein